MQAEKKPHPAPCTDCLSVWKGAVSLPSPGTSPSPQLLSMLKGGVAMGLASTLYTSFLMGGCQDREMKGTGLLGLLSALRLVLAGGAGAGRLWG